MHDIGKLILVHQFLIVTQRFALGPQRRLHALASGREVFGASHAEVGSYLLALWGFPDVVIQSVAIIAVHRCAMKAQLPPATAVHVANLLKRSEHSTRHTNTAAVVVWVGTSGCDWSGASHRHLVRAAIQGVEVSGLACS